MMKRPDFGADLLGFRADLAPCMGPPSARHVGVTASRRTRSADLRLVPGERAGLEPSWPHAARPTSVRARCVARRRRRGRCELVDGGGADGCGGGAFGRRRRCSSAGSNPMPLAGTVGEHAPRRLPLFAAPQGVVVASSAATKEAKAQASRALVDIARAQSAEYMCAHVVQCDAPASAFMSRPEILQGHGRTYVH